MTITVSIITPSFNQGRYLPLSIESVLNQDYEDIQYIVIDGGSTDSTPSVLKRYSSAIDYIHIGPDDGPADGLNRGLKIATGHAMGYLNADDIYLPGAVRRAVSSLQAGADVCYGDVVKIDAEGHFVGYLRSSRCIDLPALTAGESLVAQPGSLLRMSCIEEVGGFNSHNRTSWDHEMFVDVAARGARFMHSPGFSAAFRIHGESITGSNRLQQTYRRDMKRIAERYGQEWTDPTLSRRARQALSCPTRVIDFLVGPWMRRALGDRRIDNIPSVACA